MKIKSMAFALCASMLALSSSVYASRPADFGNKYQLEEMVVLSRHNIRSPLSGNGSALGNVTPHK